MPAKCEFKINTEVVDAWFQTDKEWKDFLHDYFSAEALNECHKCTRRFKPMFNTSARNAGTFLKFFHQVCNRCKEIIFIDCKPKTIRIPKLGGEYSVRLIQKYYKGILDKKTENRRVVYTQSTKKINPENDQQEKIKPENNQSGRNNPVKCNPEKFQSEKIKPDKIRPDKITQDKIKPVKVAKAKNQAKSTLNTPIKLENKSKESKKRMSKQNWQLPEADLFQPMPTRPREASPPEPILKKPMRIKKQ